VIEYITPFFAPELKIPDPDVDPDKAGPLPLLWPPAEPNMAAAFAAMSKPDPFIATEWWKEIEARDAKMLEDNRRQIAEAEQRQAEYEERQAAEAKKAAYERGWPQS
jgi:hypothetical protein